MQRMNLLATLANLTLLAVAPNHALAQHEHQQTDAQYTALATRIDQQVKSIVANCRLPADADANMHLIVADLLQGVALMRGEDAMRSRHDGAALVHGALNAYGQYFDDPAWKPDAPMREK